MNRLLSYPGKPLPFGVHIIEKDFVNFSLFSQRASRVTLVLKDSKGFFTEIPFDPGINKTGHIWHIALEKLSEDSCYGFKLDGPPHLGCAFNYSKILCDPYAKQICSSHKWGDGTTCLYPIPSCRSACMGYVFNPEINFDWENIRKPNIPLNELVIYEMHVRSFTADSSSETERPGTFLGIIEKIDYLKSLGINAVELMPVFEFDETRNPFKNKNFPNLCNYWGYSPVNFFSPMNRYATENRPGKVITEFKTLVKELHKNNIEVILDVVFNHTQDDQTQYYSLKGIDQEAYYILDIQGRPTNYSGCGNSINANSPPVTELIRDSLRYWATDMHVDGFRFDLGSVMTRNDQGSPLSYPPIFDIISRDPLLADVKMIIEPWDAAGLYQLGFFPGISTKFSEWNDNYRDTIRRFINGSTDLANHFSLKIQGSPDIYGKYKSPLNSINFITAHDGFTMRDVVSYEKKHNENNGENNRDGTNNNSSRNFGYEGYANNAEIEKIRLRQIKNFQLILMISGGIPMMSSGDEYGHKGEGNNNRWCHDSRINYFLWNQLQNEKELFTFYQTTIRIRKEHPILRSPYFLQNHEFMHCDIEGKKIEPPIPPSPFTGMVIQGEEYLLYAAFNISENSLKIKTPKNPRYGSFIKIAGTGDQSDQENLEMIVMEPFSAILLKSFSL